jgi:hypothetical protein
MSEAKLSAIVVALLTGIGITMTLTAAYRDLGSALAISVPVALVMGAVLAIFATDEIKKGSDKPQKDEKQGN